MSLPTPPFNEIYCRILVWCQVLLMHKNLMKASVGSRYEMVKAG